MADIEKLRKNLEDRGIQSSYFATAQAAADYLDQQIDGTTVGIGGSMTVKVMGLYPRLSAHNQVAWHWEGDSLEEAEGSVKLAITMILLHCGAKSAKTRLNRAGGYVRNAIQDV